MSGDEFYDDDVTSGFGTDCVRCGYPFPNMPGSITEPIEHECVPEPEQADGLTQAKAREFVTWRGCEVEVV